MILSVQLEINQAAADKNDGSHEERHADRSLNWAENVMIFQQSHHEVDANEKSRDGTVKNYIQRLVDFIWIEQIGEACCDQSQWH